MNNESIFVQIASYRDPELIPTIMDMFETANNPENSVTELSKYQHY